MPQPALSALVARTARAVTPPESEATDGRLLTRYAATGDEPAFAELVRRAGPMVLGVCRRVAGDDHLADDAFQAAFLVLARRAADIRPREAVRGWLYGVAVRVAQKARTMSARRRSRETPVPTVPDRAGRAIEPPDGDALRALDEEVAALPEHLRAAVVLCELDGLPRAEAAARLGVPAGTLSSRLSSARKHLARRLRGRGISLPAAGLAVLAGGSAVSAKLARAASALAAASAPVPAAVAALTHGVVRSMFLTKLKAVAPLAVAAVALALIAGAATGAREPQPPPATAAAPAPGPASPREGVIVVWRKEYAAVFKPDGTVVRRWTGDDVPEPGGVRLSPDGKTIAVLRPYETRSTERNAIVGGNVLRGTYTRHLYRITLYPVAEKLTGTDVLIPGDSVELVVWSGDGSKLYAATHADDENGTHDVGLKHYVYDLKAGKHAELKLPAGHRLKDVSPDGTLFLTVGPAANRSETQRACLIAAAGGEPIVLSGPRATLTDGRFSPDGKRLLLCGFGAQDVPPLQPGDTAVPPPVGGAIGGWLVIVPVDDPKKRTELPVKDREYANQCGWSPDGKRVVTSRQVLPEINQPAPPREIVVSDADGRNPKTIDTGTGDHLEHLFIDWR